MPKTQSVKTSSTNGNGKTGNVVVTATHDQYPTSRQGLEQAMLDLTPTVKAFGSMRIEESEEIGRVRSIVKRFATMHAQAEVVDRAGVRETIRRAVQLRDLMQKEINEAFDSASGDFDESVSFIRRENPERLAQIEDELVALQDTFRKVVSGSSFQKKVDAYTAVNDLILDICYQIEDEKQRMEQERIAQSIKDAASLL